MLVIGKGLVKHGLAWYCKKQSGEVRLPADEVKPRGTHVALTRRNLFEFLLPIIG